MLTQDQRDQLKVYAFQQCLANMFGDRQEEEYVKKGFPIFKGVDNLTDQELLQECGVDNFQQFLNKDI